MRYGHLDPPSDTTYQGITNGYRFPHLQSLTEARERSRGPALFDRIGGSLRQLHQIGGEMVATLRSAGFSLESSIRRLALSPSRPDAEMVRLFDLFDITDGLAASGAPFGLSFGGRPLYLDYCDPNLAVVLVTGGVGSGKSHLLRSLAYSLAFTTRQSQLQLLAISPAYGGEQYWDRPHQVRDPMAALDHLPHMLAPVSREREDAAEALALLADEFDYRREYGVELPHIVLIIDDLDLLIEEGGTAISEPLSRLLKVGPTCGFRLLAAIQHPTSPEVDELIGQEVGLRLVGRLESEEEKERDEGISKTQTEYFLEAGEFVAVSPGVVTPFHAAYLDAYDLWIAADVLRQPTGRVLLAQTWSGSEGNSLLTDGESDNGAAAASSSKSKEETPLWPPAKELKHDGMTPSGKEDDQPHHRRAAERTPHPALVTASHQGRWDEDQIDPDDWLDDEPFPFDADN